MPFVLAQYLPDACVGIDVWGDSPPVAWDACRAKLNGDGRWAGGDWDPWES